VGLPEKQVKRQTLKSGFKESRGSLLEKGSGRLKKRSRELEETSTRGKGKDSFKKKEDSFV